jgi:hypothetical protein
MRTLILSHVQAYSNMVSETQDIIEEFIIEKIKDRQQMLSIAGTIEKLPNKYIKDCYGFFVKAPDAKMYLQYYTVAETSPLFNMIGVPGSPIYTLISKYRSIIPNDSHLLDYNKIYNMTRTLNAYSL